VNPPPFQVLPDLPPDEYEELKRDIAARGVQVAVEITEDGEILDGHQRTRACNELKIKNYPRRIVSGLDEVGKRHHAIRANCLRRHLTREQRRDLITAELRRDPRQSNPFLASLMGVDPKTIDAVRRDLVSVREIPELGRFPGSDGKSYPAHKMTSPNRPTSMIAHSPGGTRKAQETLRELGDDLPTGKHMSPRDASTLLNQKRRERADCRAKDIPLPRDRVQLHEGDFRQVGRQIRDGSADLCFTDPPYGQEFLPRWDEIGAFAARVLKPGSLLVTYTGQTYLGPVLAALSAHLSYVWCMALVHDHGTSRIHHKRVINAWKPLLVFGKGTARFPDTIKDVFHGTGADKQHHAWEQGLDEAVHFLRALVPPGGLVVDPCTGGATTAVASLRCGLRFEGCETDPETCRRARKRIAQESENV
jgi:hypothetical protein